LPNKKKKYAVLNAAGKQQKTKMMQTAKRPRPA